MQIRRRRSDVLWFVVIGLIIFILVAALAACSGDPEPEPTPSPPVPSPVVSVTTVYLPSPSPYASTVVLPVPGPARTRVVPGPTRVVPGPTRVVTVRPTPKPTPSIFASCAEMREFFPNGVQEGTAWYRAALDTDSNGWACEPTQP